MRDRSQEQKGRKGRVAVASGDDVPPGRSLSQHEGIPVWCDCCPCEAEPYWVAVAEELGIDLDAPGDDGDARHRRRQRGGGSGNRG